MKADKKEVANLSQNARKYRVLSNLVGVDGYQQLSGRKSRQYIY